MGRTKRVGDDVILSAARQLFLEMGLKAPTVDIARRAGISEGTLFQRYRTKAELFFASMTLPEASFQGLFDRGPNALEAREHFFAVARTMLTYFREAAPTLTVLMSNPDFEFEDFARRFPDNSLVSLRDQVMKFLHDLRREGAVRDREVRSVALLLFTSLYGVAVFEHMGAHQGTMPDFVVDPMIDHIWEVLAPRS